MQQEQEFIQLLNKHQNIIHKVCSVYMNDYADKEDLFQEVTLQAWKAYASFRGDAKFSTWLYRVALNTAITFYRKEKNKYPLLQQKRYLKFLKATTQSKIKLKQCTKPLANSVKLIRL
jgi:RNA polymerase sigma-70 factor (ECF subfamily)